MLALEDPAEEFGGALNDGTVTPLVEGDAAALEEVVFEIGLHALRETGIADGEVPTSRSRVRHYLGWLIFLAAAAAAVVLLAQAVH